MKSVSEVLALSTAFLSERQTPRARRSAEELLAAILGLKRLDLYLQYDRPLIKSELEQMRQFLKRRAAGEPVDYIVGRVEFAGASFAVSRDVLIPRIETEILVDLVSKELARRSSEGKILWDLCTGSGCIGIALKKKFPWLAVSLSDNSPAALAAARKNGIENGVEVDFRLGDLFAPFQGEKADFILANPPYVSRADYGRLDPSVRDYEPREALVGGETGIEYYERLSRCLPDFLNKGGLFACEIGEAQGEAVRRLFGGGRVVKDWFERDRFFFLEVE